MAPLVLFTVLGPIAAGLAAAMCLRAFGPAIAVRRMHRRRRALLPVPVEHPDPTYMSDYSEVGGHIARWFAPTKTVMTTAFMAVVATAAVATVLGGTWRQGIFEVYDAGGGACYVTAAEPGFVEYVGYVTCFAQPSRGDLMAFITLPAPFEGSAFSLEVAVTAIAVPTLLTVTLIASHLLGLRSRPEGAGQAIRVGAQPGRQQLDDYWLKTYLPEVASKLGWPDLPAESDDLTQAEIERIFDGRPWHYHALRGRDGGWMLMLSGPWNDRPVWLLRPDRQPPLRGAGALLPRDAPPAGRLMICTAYSRSAREAKGLMSDRWIAAYDGLEEVDDFTRASLREDIEGQIRDRAEDSATPQWENLSQG